MSNTAELNQLFNKPTEQVLQEGLHQMTVACEAITKQNEILNVDIKNLKNKLRHAEERLLLNASD
tara:strand:- start:482 stop:676 length:195 start_codon:yes stop_codon:yes gene_type:complete